MLFVMIQKKQRDNIVWIRLLIVKWCECRKSTENQHTRDFHVERRSQKYTSYKTSRTVDSVCHLHFSVYFRVSCCTLFYGILLLFGNGRWSRKPSYANQTKSNERDMEMGKTEIMHKQHNISI